MLDIPRFLVTYDNHKRQPDLTVVLLHGIGSKGEMWHRLNKQFEPLNIRVVAFDLLGFGKSPKPRRASYSLRQHARAVSMSILRAGVLGRVVFVGHSLGGLIAIECAKRYPWMVDKLILCSPPIYRSATERASTLFTGEKILTDIYETMQVEAKARPERFVALVERAQKAKMTPQALQLTSETLHSYMAALRNSIVSQTSYHDVQHLKCPVTIIYGRMDPLVLPANFRRIARSNPTIALRPVVGFHEITRPFIKAIVHSVVREKPTPPTSRSSL